MGKKYYFVSFVHQTNMGVSFGNTYYELDREHFDTSRVAKIIEFTFKKTNVTIINFKKISKGHFKYMVEQDNKKEVKKEEVKK